MAIQAEDLVSSGLDLLLSEGKTSLRILMTGLVGTGKSTLVNSILGDNVAQVAFSPSLQTVRVTKYQKKVQNVAVTIYDDPGLCNPFDGPDADIKRLEEINEDVDVVLYCVRMNSPRISQDDIYALRKLSRAFGKEKFWEKTLFVLTLICMYQYKVMRSTRESWNGRWLFKRSLKSGQRLIAKWHKMFQ